MCQHHVICKEGKKNVLLGGNNKWREDFIIFSPPAERRRAYRVWFNNKSFSLLGS